MSCLAAGLLVAEVVSALVVAGAVVSELVDSVVAVAADSAVAVGQGILELGPG